MALISPTLPEIGQLNATEDVDLRNTLVALLAEFNGNIDNANVKAGAGIVWSKLQNGAMLLEQAGSNADGAIRRGKAVTAAEHTRNSNAYGALNGTLGVDATDEVRDVVLPADGLLVVLYHGMFKSSVGGTGSAAIFVGANQVKEIASSASAPAVQEAVTSGVNNYEAALSSETGLVTSNASGAYSGPVATGQIVGDATTGGGACYIFAAAGTYDISVQFKATSGTVTGKERKLWVVALGF